MTSAAPRFQMPAMRNDPGQDLEPGQDERGDKGERLTDEPVVADILGEVERVEDLDDPGIDEQTAEDEAEDEQDGLIPDHRPFRPFRLLLGQAGLRPFLPAAGEDTDVAEALVVQAPGQGQARLAVAALAIDDEDHVPCGAQEAGGQAQPGPGGGDIPGPRDVALREEPLGPGVQDDRQPRPPKVLPFGERDHADPRVFGSREERVPELAPGEPTDQRELDGRGDEDGERPEAQGLPKGPPRFVHGSARFQPWTARYFARPALKTRTASRRSCSLTT